MKRSELFDYVMKNLDKDEPFNMVYLKKNGERREALGKIRDIEADKRVKGTGMNRQEKNGSPGKNGSPKSFSIL